MKRIQKFYNTLWQSKAIKILNKKGDNVHPFFVTIFIIIRIISITKTKTMENLVKYKPIAVTIFKQFLNGELCRVGFYDSLLDLENLITDDIQSSNPDFDMWFRFFKGDTAATTCVNIHADLYGSTNNYNNLIESLKIAIETDELEIYYS